MPRFTYTARDPAGQTVDSTLDAPSRKDAARLLAARGLKPLRLQEAAAPAASGGRRTANAQSAPAAPAERASSDDAKFGPDQQLPFLQSLAELIGSGMPAGEAVRLLSLRLQEPRLRALCAALWERLAEGLPLSQAMESLGRVFPGQTVNLIAAGEATGNLREVIQRLITHYTAQREMRQLIFTAALYPCIVLGVAFLAVLGFVFFVLPRLQSLLNSLGGEMPLATRLLISLSDALVQYGLFAVLGVIFTWIFFWRWRRTERGRHTTDRWALRLPLVGRFVSATTIQNFCATLAVLLENGVTTAEALRMTERTIANRSLQDAFSEATGRVLEGESLSQSLGKTGHLPPLVIDRLSVGESTGQLAPSLRGIAQTFQQQLARQIATFTQLFSIGVLLVAFGFVAFVAVAMISAVFQVSASFKF